MKTSLLPLGIALLTAGLIEGCASAPRIVTAPVGPAASGDEAGTQEGVLVVYSATEEHVVGDGPSYHPYSGYTIQSKDGKFSKYVTNHTGSMDEKPKMIYLPSGEYTVSAQSMAYGRVTVPVVIASRKITRLHLDGEMKTKLVATNDSSLVKLPNGQVIGWHAHEVLGQ